MQLRSLPVGIFLPVHRVKAKMEEVINDEIAESLLMWGGNTEWSIQEEWDHYRKHDIVTENVVYQHLPTGRYFHIQGTRSYDDGLSYEGYSEVKKQVKLKEEVTWVLK